MSLRYITIVLLCSIASACVYSPQSKDDGGDETLGYHIDKGEVVFVFDKRDYERASKNGTLKELEFSEIDIHKVAVAGDFNKWSKEGWKMRQIDENIFELRKKLKDFDDKFEWEYKFVVNDKYWAEPPVKASNRRDSEVMPRGHYLPKRENLVLTLEDPEALVGNTEFVLEGFPNAKQIVLAGSFNNWQTHQYRLVRQGNTWIYRLDLPSGNHEYKFIVDGRWITDPINPVKIADADFNINSVIFKNPNAKFRLSGYQDAHKVLLSGTFNNWNTKGYEMYQKNGEWVIDIHLSKGKHLYKFVVDGEWITDPDNPNTESNEYKQFNSVRHQL